MLSACSLTRLAAVWVLDTAAAHAVSVGLMPLLDVVDSAQAAISAGAIRVAANRTASAPTGTRRRSPNQPAASSHAQANVRHNHAGCGR